MSGQDELISSVGVDYTSLCSELASGQWQKADEETGAIMLKITRRVTAGWLTEEDIQEFPCPDLQTINQLWVKYSNERFGFTVQSRIWENVGEDYSKFSDAVGWQLTVVLSSGDNTLTSSSAYVLRSDTCQLRRFLSLVGRLSGGPLLLNQNFWTAMPKISEENERAPQLSLTSDRI